MEKDYIILCDPTLDHAAITEGNSFTKLKELLKDGWERADVPYNPYGTEVMRIMELVKYTAEEKAEIEAIRAARTSSPRPVIDENCLTVPIISYDDEQKKKENPYKILAAKGYTEVHRTSSVAVMKLTDPRGVILSDRDLEIIVKNLRVFNPFKDTEEEYNMQVELFNRLSMILKTSLEAKAVIAPPPQ